MKITKFWWNTKSTIRASSPILVNFLQYEILISLKCAVDSEWNDIIIVGISCSVAELEITKARFYRPNTITLFSQSKCACVMSISWDTCVTWLMTWWLHRILQLVETWSTSDNGLLVLESNTCKLKCLWAHNSLLHRTSTISTCVCTLYQIYSNTTLINNIESVCISGTQWAMHYHTW